MLSGCTTLGLTRSSLSMGKEAQYDVSYVDGKVHILRKNFEP